MQTTVHHYLFTLCHTAVKVLVALFNMTGLGVILFAVMGLTTEIVIGLNDKETHQVSNLQFRVKLFMYELGADVLLSVFQNKLSIEQLILYYRLIMYHSEILSKFCAPFCNILSQLLVQNKSAK